MQERYRLLHLTAPAVEELEASIRKLREVIAAHKETIAEKEAEIGCNSPAVFRTLQVGKDIHRHGVRLQTTLQQPAAATQLCSAAPRHLTCEATELLEEESWIEMEMLSRCHQ